MTTPTKPPTRNMFELPIVPNDMRASMTWPEAIVAVAVILAITVVLLALILR